MSNNDLIAAAAGTVAASSEWDVRGHLAASLTCWHRLTSKEAAELVALFQGRPYVAPKGAAYAALPKPVYQWTDGTRTLHQDVVSAIRDYAGSRPETGEDWESWFEAAFDLLGRRVNEIFEEHTLRAARAPAESVQRDALPTIKGASITGGYVVVTPAGWGDGKAAVLRDAILCTFPVNPALSPKPDAAALATKGGA